MRSPVLPSVLLALCLVSAALADQAPIPVDIKADQLKYFENSDLVEAAGSVEVKLKGLTIRSDRLLLDSASNTATAEGHVSVYADDYSAAASSLFYDADKETTRFTDFHTQLAPATLSGPLYLSAPSFTDAHNIKKMSGGPALCTTCDREEPHYYLIADKFDYFPDDHLEGRNVTVWVGEIPVFWLPYLYYDLHAPQGRKNWTFGHNDVEGNYLKTAWAYPLGTFLLNYMDKKGIGYGTESNYALGALGAGAVSLYHLDERDTAISDWVTKISHEKQINKDLTFKLDQSYISTYRIPYSRIDQTAVGLDLDYAAKARWGLGFNVLDDRVANDEHYDLGYNQSSGRESANYYYNYDFSKIAPTWLRKSQQLSYTTQLTDRINFSTTTSYYHSVAQAGDSGQEKVEPQINLTGSDPNYSWRYSQNWFIDLRRDLYTIEAYEFLEKQPEFQISPRPIDLKLFSLQSTFGYGFYREVRYVPELGHNRDFSASRLQSTLNGTRSVPLGLGSVLSLGAGLDQFLYGPGDELYALRENAGLQTNLSSCFRNEINVRQAYTDGNTPFFFDQLGTTYHDITERMTFYYLSKFNWYIEGGHNWQTNKYYDVMTSLSVTPDPRFRLNLTTGWDIEDRRYKLLVTSLGIKPAQFYGLDFSLSQDLNGTGLQTASALHDLYILQGAPNQIHLKFSQVFDAVTKEFKVRDIMLVKDLHCWEMSFRYSDYTKDYSFVFSLKAMPGEPVGFASGRGFYFDEFQQQLDQMNPQGSVSSY